MDKFWPFFHKIFSFGHNFWTDANFSIHFHCWSKFFLFFSHTSIMTISKNTMCQAIMANTDKLAILAVMTWLHMTMTIADIFVYAKNRENVDQQWKWNWKICIGSKVMAKTKSTLKLWPFPLYFCPLFSRNWPLLRKHFPLVLRAYLYVFGIRATCRMGKAG